jgi:hypothetical protein
MLYAAAGSPNLRLNELGPSLIGREEWTLWGRLAWYARCGVFLKGLFDIVTDSNVDYENNRTFETLAWARYVFFRRESFLAGIFSGTRAGVWKESGGPGGETEMYWQQTTGVEATVYRGNRGCMLFVNYILDDIPLYRSKPRFSKDRLAELGVKIFM